MTQFLIFTGPKPNLKNHKGLIANPLQNDDISGYVGPAISDPDKPKSWVLRGRQGEPGHELCDDAIMEIQNGKNFLETELGTILSSYIPDSKSITFFYGTDSEDLQQFNKKVSFFKHLSECLSGTGPTPWEIYSKFNNRR